MSERGTFMTSFLYDTRLAGILAPLLTKVARGRRLVADFHPMALDEARAYFGVMHGGYAGEEAWEMQQLIEDEILPALPEEHGTFSITVTPEDEKHTVLFTFGRGKEYMMYRLNPKLATEVFGDV